MVFTRSNTSRNSLSEYSILSPLHKKAPGQRPGASVERGTVWDVCEVFQTPLPDCDMGATAAGKSPDRIFVMRPGLALAGRIQAHRGGVRHVQRSEFPRCRDSCNHVTGGDGLFPHPRP